MASHASTRKPGRPRSATIERRIISAAQTYFACHDFDSVVMEKLAWKVGISKTTLYRYFRTKGDLFKAVLEHLLGQLPRASELTSGVVGSAEQRLLTIATRASSLLSSPSFGLIQRALASDLSPQLREHIRQKAVFPYLEAVQDYLRNQAAQGMLALKDARSATLFFMALIVGPEALRSQWSGSTLGPIDDAHLRDAVQVFIKGHQ